MKAVDVLDRALQNSTAAEHAPASVRELLSIAAEVVDALGAVRLSAADQQRIYARSLALVEHALDEQRRGWRRVPHLDRRVPAIIGGAALTLGAAALGWAVLHGRHASSRPAAA